MMTCKQVHKALAAGDYQDLSPFRRFMLRMHVAMCFMCHGFNHNIMVFQDTARAFREHEDELTSDAHLSEDARERMRQSISSARSS